jgi:hypothetical protein
MLWWAVEKIRRLCSVEKYGGTVPLHSQEGTYLKYMSGLREMARNNLLSRVALQSLVDIRACSGPVVGHGAASAWHASSFHSDIPNRRFERSEHSL